MEDKKKIYYYIAGGALATLGLAGFYFLYKKLSKPKLNPWLEEYFTEIQEMISRNGGNEPTLEIIGHTFNIISEVEEYLYTKENKDLEEERVAAINNEREYRALFAETMEVRNEFYEKAASIVESKLHLTMQQMDEALRKFDMKESKEALRSAKKSYATIPDVSSSKVRDAFIFYVREKKFNEEFIRQQLYMSNMNPDYKTKAMANIYYVKNKLRDQVKAKFGFDDKYFDQLIQKHNLGEDSEIKYYQEELKIIE